MKTAPEGGKCLVGFYEDFLGHILGRLGFSRNFDTYSVHHALITIDQMPKGLVLAA